MAEYDIFLKNKHSDKIAERMIKNNIRLLDFLVDSYFKKQNKIKILEVGPGKGYFKQAVYNRNGKHNQDRGGNSKQKNFSNEKKEYEYFAVDRNENMILNLKIDSKHGYVADLLNFKADQKFDIILAGYVIEHLPDGIALYRALNNLKALLNDTGILVLLFPNSMKLGMELYNIDYTHCFPTTKRNVNQAILDSSMYVDQVIDLCGILYTKKVNSKLQYRIKTFIMSFYHYNLINLLMSLFYHVPIWDLKNVFWRAYGLLKEPNVCFITKKN